MPIRAVFASLFALVWVGACGPSKTSTAQQQSDPAEVSTPEDPSTAPVDTSPQSPTVPIPDPPTPIDPPVAVTHVTLSLGVAQGSLQVDPDGSDVPTGSFQVSPAPVTRVGDVLTYQQGVTVTVHAVAGEGYGFVGWHGDIASGHNPAVITLSADVTATAKLARALFVSTTGDDTAGLGTAARPYRTIKNAILTAQYRYSEVHVEAGIHEVTLPFYIIGGVSLRGGYSVGFVERSFEAPEDRANVTYQTLVRPVDASEWEALAITDLTTPADRATVLEGFTITPPSSGPINRTVYVSNTSPTIRYNTIIATGRTTSGIVCEGCGALVEHNLVTVDDASIPPVGTYVQTLIKATDGAMELSYNQLVADQHSSNFFDAIWAMQGRLVVTNNVVSVGWPSSTLLENIATGGIRVSSAQSVTISGNSLLFNDLSTAAATAAQISFSAVSVSDCDVVEVADNQLAVGHVEANDFVTGYGVSVATSSEVTLTRNDVEISPANIADGAVFMLSGLSVTTADTLVMDANRAHIGDVTTTPTSRVQVKGLAVSAVGTASVSNNVLLQNVGESLLQDLGGLLVVDSGASVRHNSVVFGAQTGFNAVSLSGSTVSGFENNIIVATGSAALTPCLTCDNCATTPIANNDFLGCDTVLQADTTSYSTVASINDDAALSASGNISIDPGFVSLATGDLKLTTTEENLNVRIGAKEVTGGPSTDIEGKPRTFSTPPVTANEGASGMSIGAYEVD